MGKWLNGAREVRAAVDGMTGLPSVSKLAAFLETIREIIKPKEG